jgi:hypothetical protein
MIRIKERRFESLAVAFASVAAKPPSLCRNSVGGLQSAPPC